MRNLLGLVLVLAAGCATVSAEGQQQIRDCAAASAADERQNDIAPLTSDQVKVALHDSARAWATLNNVVNGASIPDAYTK